MKYTKHEQKANEKPRKSVNKWTLRKCIYTLIYTKRKWDNKGERADKRFQGLSSGGYLTASKDHIKQSKQQEVTEALNRERGCTPPF